MDLSIIIVNYNVFDEVKECIVSIHKCIKNLNIEIIVVDNKSSEKSIYEINSFFKEIKFIPLGINAGFAKANNIGVKNSESEFICFLNPDTVIIEDFIAQMINFIKSNDNTGACAPMLLYEDHSYQSSTGFKMGFLYEFLEAFMIINLYRKTKECFYLKEINNKPVRVGWVSAACLIIKKSVFDKVGGFSEDYFLNYEDIDLCKKLEEEGYENYYFPYLKCIHLHHKSFDKNYELLVFSRYQSRLKYAKLHYNLFIEYTVRLIHIAGILLRLIFVNFLYSGIEKKSRKTGYLKSLYLYIGIKHGF